MSKQAVKGRTELPKRSVAGLNAANFFQAGMVGVVMPVLGAFLQASHWRYDAIGMATAIPSQNAHVVFHRSIEPAQGVRFAIMKGSYPQPDDCDRLKQS